MTHTHGALATVCVQHAQMVAPARAFTTLEYFAKVENSFEYTPFQGSVATSYGLLPLGGALPWVLSYGTAPP